MPTAKPIERSRKSDGSKTASTTPSFRASFAFIMVLLFRAFNTITCTARSGPISLGKIVAPPHPGINPRNTSGSPVSAVEASVRYWLCKPTSNPPPRAKPFINAKVGIFDSPRRRKTSWPSFPNATD